jgi:hypothetical protein
MFGGLGKALGGMVGVGADMAKPIGKAAGIASSAGAPTAGPALAKPTTGESSKTAKFGKQIFGKRSMRR